jgi:hypothetical protein
MQGLRTCRRQVQRKGLPQLENPMSISQKSAHQTHEAIVFFTGGGIGKEMLYTEFEALLDCVVPMRDFAGREQQAAYVRLDAGLSVVAVVLFVIRFDASGFPEQSWNVPLRQLAESGARGPDLGGGPVRLATRSQCPMPGQEKNLWDIQFGREGNTLDLLRERLRGNRLGIDATELAPRPPPPSSASWTPPGASAQPRAPASTAATDSSETVLAVMQQGQQQMAMMQEQYQRELASMQERLGELQQRLHALENEKGLLHQQLEETTRHAEEAHRRDERKLQMIAERARAQLEAQRQELEAARDAVLAERDEQLRAALAERDSHMSEELGRLERERQLQEDQLLSLRTELTELRRDKLRLMGDGADKFFDSLKEKGVKFVAFQPGAGHITIPMEDLNRYLEDTETFVAEKCHVSVEQYRKWLAHYNSPVCQGSAGHGGPCNKPLTRLLKPAEFVAGMHDRCDIHKQVPRSQTLRDKTA